MSDFDKPPVRRPYRVERSRWVIEIEEMNGEEVVRMNHEFAIHDAQGELVSLRQGESLQYFTEEEQATLRYHAANLHAKAKATAD